MLGAIYIPVHQVKPPQDLVHSYASGLTVRAPVEIVHPEDRSVEWRGGVQATFGPSVLVADSLILHDADVNPYGQATGNVRLTDPEGSLTASDLTFYWASRTGTAHQVSANVDMVTFRADSVDIKPGLWVLRGVYASGCDEKMPLYAIRTRELRIRPEQDVVAVRPSLELFHHHVFTLPNQKLSLSGGGGSIDLPYPTFRPGRGLGINWTSGFDLGEQTALFTRYAVFQRTLPFYNATLLHSLVRGSAPDPVRTEIGDRFTFGYFDNVQVRDPQSEQTYLGARRLEFGLASTFGADARDTTTSEDKINKPIELIGEASGPIGPFKMMGIARAQQVRVGGGANLERLVTEENLLTPQLRFGRNLYAFGRVDAAQFTGGNAYSWLRGQAGLVFEASPQLRFSAGYASAHAFGTPDFAYDQPFRFREVSFRADLDSDTTQLRLLVKYDPAVGAIYDREVYFSHVLGCIEPYVVYRERPHKFFVGIKLPLTRVFERVSKEALKRREAIREAIGP